MRRSVLFFFLFILIFYVKPLPAWAARGPGLCWSGDDDASPSLLGGVTAGWLDGWMDVVVQPAFLLICVYKREGKCCGYIENEE